MKTLRREQLQQALKTIGIQPGDGLLVHSAIQFLGEPEGGVEMYFNAIMRAIGVEGTMAVPTFNFEFAETGEFDLQRTPSIGMGAFSEYVRTLPQACRTTHPMQSLAVIGKAASDLAKRDTPCAFDDGSAFDRMLQLDFKLLLLGASIQAASIIHYSEQRANVPYRYWKDFKGTIKTSDRAVRKTYRMFVRDLELDPRLVITDIQEKLTTRGQWESVILNYGQIAVCRLTDFVKIADEMLAKDAWSFVTNRPAKERD